ncbi:probable LRR receptor-like serine/threonine-protein kinase At3g47570 [Zingiber officinale]|uniref:Receptor kinase-like protein Xa21 n=1 Tax=Zingiber officinale TaxID=94328 RepID=A0A8J5KXM4_ZINOF|nr:probable LRR receptor-like serine/threonine-protein kinase At3g47570 [Zingiber officinale]KAG6496917.1 hypothetical protein ZIOFF_044796 [Zingiber officinale]
MVLAIDLVFGFFLMYYNPSTVAYISLPLPLPLLLITMQIHRVIRPLFHFTLLFSLSSSSSEKTNDELALLSFKDSIAGDPLGALESWNNNTLHFCQWRGVTCGAASANRQRVIVLDLDSLHLVGSISPSICNLTFLKRLHLPNNNLQGRIPSQLGQLIHLQYLNLSSNSLGGELPRNLTQCKDLQVISLNQNMFAGPVPAELGSLSKLTQLLLYSNNFTGVIPSSLGNISSLTLLLLAENFLEGRIPENIATISGLEYFNVAANMLSGKVPSSIYNLSGLYYLNVGNNQLHGELPSDIGHTLPKLQFLGMYGNQFQGSIPSSLANASGLEVIGMDNNSFSGIIPANLGTLKNLSWLILSRNKLENSELSFITSLTNCTNLVYLELYRNELRGVLPRSIANFSATMNWLTIGHNHISGSIPPEIENLVGLSALFMEENILTGVIPDAIGKLQGLNSLWLFDNKLSGDIPVSIGNLTLLTHLYLQVNNLQGNIPSSLGNLQALSSLNLSSNNLSGGIPKEVVTLSLSWYLDLSFNSLTGSLPMEVSNLKNLNEFNVSNNKLSGEIPSSLGECRVLDYLYLGNNNFEGIIPQSLSNLRGIQEIDLSQNRLSGRIPDFFASLDSLQYLNLSYNNLEGAVPTGGIFANISFDLIAGNDNLCGGPWTLHLHPCIRQETKTKITSVIRIALPVGGGAVILCLLACLLLVRGVPNRSRMKSSSLESNGSQYPRVSYADLHKATDGFTSSNLIGSGSFGSVYRGTHNGQLVAVKVFNLQQRGASKSFMAECEALRSIRHRNLLKVITSCSSIDSQGEEFKAIVYDFMPRGNLDEWLQLERYEHEQSKGLSLVQRLSIAIDVASALEYLHCQGQIVHCDLKPSNVLLDDNLVAHVGDFGLARFLDSDCGNSSTASSISLGLKGSIGYVAPEYGMGSQVSPLGDVYSFGILLLEMLTGLRPTNELFNDGLNIRIYANESLTRQVIDVVDPKLYLDEDLEAGKLCELLTSLFRIGLGCCEEDPRKRMQMVDVIKELHSFRDSIVAL